MEWERKVWLEEFSQLGAQKSLQGGIARVKSPPRPWQGGVLGRSSREHIRGVAGTRKVFWVLPTGGEDDVEVIYHVR
jgi:hypothetical protein